MRRAILLLLGGVLAALLIRNCTQTGTESAMLEWGQVLNVHLATGGKAGNYNFPEQLSEIAPELRGHLATVDTWGNQYVYRRIRDDMYQLISVGKDGIFGNEDDVILQNGAFYAADKIYSETPP